MINNTNNSNKNNKNNSIDNNKNIYVTNLSRRFDADIKEFLQICLLCYNSIIIIFILFFNGPHETQGEITLYYSVLTISFFTRDFLHKYLDSPDLHLVFLFFIMPPHIFLNSDTYDCMLLSCHVRVSEWIHNWVKELNELRNELRNFFLEAGVISKG